ncbi:MAG: carboxypeptidase-like regulatory domain-containing protein, partial [Candidatus Acidiferrales bacterium]
MFATAPSALFAQSATTGLITGTVTDPSGAIVVGASVTLSQHTTNATQTTLTDSAGRYVFPAANPADYTLTFSAKGFENAVTNELHVEVLKSYTINVTLQLGAASQTVTVTDVETAELQTTSATVGAVLGGIALEALPVFTRSASALMFYQPAVSPSGQITGARDEQVTFSFDGGDVTSDLEGSNGYAAPPGEPSPSPVVPIPIESTQEFQVATTNPNATFGRSSGGQVALLTKAGNNGFHGSAYEYHNDDALNANGWTNNRLRLPKPHSVDNRFGFTAGGPILKDRFWFFANYEGRRFHDDSIFNTVVPTPTLAQGILQFHDSAGNTVQYSLQPGNITTACGGVSCDPRNLGFNPVIKSQLALYPAGNNSSIGDGLNTTGFTFNAPTPISENIAVLRLDYKINAKWSVFATYHYAKVDRVGTEQFSILNTSAPASTAGDPIYPQFSTFEVTGQLSPNWTSVSHGSFLRDWWGWSRQAPSPLVSGTQQALVLAGEGSGTNNSTSKLLADPVNLATQSARARVFDGHKWYLAQDFSWIHGRHLFQFGASGDLSHDYFVKTDNFAGGLTAGPLLYSESTGNGSGEFLKISSTYEPPICPAIGSTANCLKSGDALRWNELYTSLLGMVDRSSQVLTRDGQFQPNPLGTPAFSQTFIPAVNAYFQDIWQLRPSFTLTLGLNWGAQPVPTEATGKYDVLVYAGTNTPVDYQGYLQ